ncbi:DUF6151 family protein [Pseudoalteromonas luteoviolacea]|uniref:CENP-V/GFA domain-containing protein n=1 Tax=Pseudoalteromonas luteoviolacea S4054 TaxID=1129367 RepID=A0A0F6A7N8_9GAMM|nr:DUF6151 family protein [Pseudoalteromonas luteoviolacea]AOT06788.1 hypothetical protein S4054249_02370 [Pseudoalteromonas luteoviolacea]AOT11706.1 hypothetical protein S40542_02370 [Pseudoalteromonas luteoviolacea]AOT16618.1 hypothetical protein S4054_02370 [Pseudoalteromonas luteoviolacea]KKE82143.1 hypothetical protein N479_19705 [Pseudoalteromonas luteoviolacea S4054]KZN74107.1 hypothetical protein N481_10365 [Pseudoalteromonas luteoviolacea S4047-1]
MEQCLHIKCQCGKVRGQVSYGNKLFHNRVVCYCDDCQAFVNHLKQSNVLNAYGGSDVFQVSASQLIFTQGKSNIACLTVTLGGVHRWFAKCCNTPLGNTLSARWPLVGLLDCCIEEDLDACVGRPSGSVFCKFANGEIPYEVKGSWSHKQVAAQLIMKIALWRLLRKGKPSPFYAQGNPIVQPYCLADKGS